MPEHGVDSGPMADDDVERLRADTPGVQHVRHFNHAGASLPPQPVMDATIGHLQREAEIGGYEAFDAAEERLEDVYAQIAGLVGASPAEVALMENGTRGWDMVVYGIPFRKGDRVVTTMSEYGSNVIAMLQIAKRGVDLIVVPDDERGQIDLERLDAQLDSRVRAVLVSHMPTNGGLIQPAEEIGRIVRDRAPDAWYVLDAIQTVGQISLDMAAIGCDALAGTSRKYLRGPRGAGFVVVRQDRLDELEPPMIDNQAATWTGPRSYQLRPDARRFESWEANHAARLGMGVAVAYAREIGIERIAARIVRQAERLRSELSGLAGVTVRDQGRQQGGIVTLTHERLTPLEIKEFLGNRGINVSITTVQSTRFDMEARGLDAMVRASVHAITTDAEIEALIGGIHDLMVS
ncbi:MAG: aminotransferase class V-fold PLP-dependent enzyme [Chloroflexota bacterium]|nr:aminotransferase class V-fold PLP-dependent enzyme [Chloroflexota bacterium]